MIWGRLHPNVVLVGDKTVSLPACIGEPPRQIEIEEVSKTFENKEFVLVKTLEGYRLTFILSFENLSTAQMREVIDIQNHQDDIKLQPWSDKDQFYDVVRLDPEWELGYNNDKVVMKFKTKNLVTQFYIPTNILLPRINRTGGVYG